MDKIIRPLLLILFIIINFSILTNSIRDGNLEKNEKITGDFVYYLEGAQSILEFNAHEKFNNKKQPIIGSAVIKEADLPKFSSEIAILYPNSSFKFGYSLTSAILTGWLPNEVFEYTVPRLAFANIILGIFLIPLIFSIIFKLTNNIASSTFVVLLITLDTFNLNNNLVYQSHTISGIFFAVLAGYIFTRKEILSNSEIFLIGNLLSFSVLSSSHILPFDLALGLSVLFWIYQKNINREKAIALFILGGLFWVFYILFVEWYLNFNKIGIPTFFAQYKGYASAVRALMQTYSLSERQIWSFGLWNYFYDYILCLLIISACIYYKELLNIINKYNIKNISKGQLITSSLVFFILINSIFSQPIARALVPSLFIVNVFLGIYLGILFSLDKVFSKITVYIILFLVVLNFELYNFSIKKNNSYYISKNDIFKKFDTEPIKEMDKVWSQVHKYFAKMGEYKIPVGEYGKYSMGTEEFVESIEKKYNGNVPNGIKIRLEPMDIVEGYSNTRRFIPAFTKLNENLISPKVICEDYKLYCEIFQLIKNQKIKYVMEDVLYYNPTVFDQEYNYIYGYNGKIHIYLKELDIDEINFRKIYYIDYLELKNANKYKK
jgi:hypothetical protein